MADGIGYNPEDIDLGTVLEKGLDSYRIIDVRSEGEYEEDHIPGSINIPILNNEERAAVGTVYKHEGTKNAKLLAVKLLSPKLPDFISKIDRESGINKNLLITCWRGGMRSGAAVTLSRLAGVRSLRLSGGYAGFRRHVHSFFENLEDNYTYITVFGKTGCGKTDILRQLDLEGYPVIDLEKHACHKGSSFGEIGEVGYRSVTQKSFETGIWLDFYKHKSSNIFVIEGESPKIGKVNIPKRLSDNMRKSVRVLADAPLDFRIGFTVKAYEPDKYMEGITRCLERIEKYIGKVAVARLKELLAEGKIEEFTGFMLESYYDPMYKNAFPKEMDYCIEYPSVDEGVNMLKDIFGKVKGRG